MVHALAGDGLDRSHAGRRAAARLGARRGSGSRGARWSRRWYSCRSCSRRWSSRPRSSPCSRTASSARSSAILLAHVFFNVAVVVRVVGAFWAGLDQRLWDAAATLGASPADRQLAADATAARPRARVGRVDRLPLLLHVVRGDPHPRRAALRDSRDRDLQPGGASASTSARPRRSRLLQLAAVAAAVLVSGRLERRLGGRSPPGSRRAATDGPGACGRGGRRTRGRSRSSPLPPLALVLRSLQVGTGYGLDHFTALARRDAGAARDALARDPQLARSSPRPRLRSRSRSGSPPRSPSRAGGGASTSR